MSIKGAINPNRTSEIFKKLRISPIKALYKYYTPHNINLAGGLPLELCFPFKSIQVNLDGGSEDNNYTLTKGDDLHLNYHMSEGLPPLKNWAKEHVQTIHNPPFAYDVSMTIGATDSWYKIIELLSTECVLFDQYVYGASITPCNTLGKRAIGVPSDSHGIIPSALRESVLIARENGFVVDLLYLIPVGHNPMGVTMSIERKQEIYNVCCELDLIVVEDDAYYYLYYPEGEELPGVRNLPKSMLSLDTEGRVIRIDSVAKMISPGMRVGWITAPPDFITKYVLLQSQGSQFPSSVSQSMLLGLLRHWGEEGLHGHLESLQRHYRRQRDVFIDALKTHFNPEQCTYTEPTGGMFLWLSFPTLAHLSTHEVFEAFAKADVIVAPGNSFFVPGIYELLESGVQPALGPDGKCATELEGIADATVRATLRKRAQEIPCVRACYAAAGPEKIVQAVQAMADCVKALENSNDSGNRSCSSDHSVSTAPDTASV